MTEFNVGIVGLGHVATHHRAAIERSDDFRLVAVCDPDASKFSLVDSHVLTFTSISELLHLGELDVVVVASPNLLHVQHGIEAMAAGKWVLMEKPLAESQAEFDRFAARRAELDGRCTIALHSSFGLDVEWFCENLENGRLPPLSLASFRCSFYDRYFDDGVLQKRAASLGGAWVDSGINALSVICRILDPEHLTISDSRMTRLRGVGCSEVQGSVDLRFAREGIYGTGTIDTNWTLGRDQKATNLISADSTEYLLDHSAQSVVCREGARESVLYACDNGLPRLTNHYVGVFADLAAQMHVRRDNFERCSKLHRLFFEGAVGME